MPGHRPVGGLGRAGGDVQPQPGPVGTHRPTGGRARSAGRPTGAQRYLPGQLGPQVPAGLQVDRLVDRLVRHPHLRPVGELDTKPGGDLLRGPPSPQPPQHYPAQPAAHRQLRTPWTRPDPHRRPVRTRRFVGHLRPVEGHRMPMQRVGGHLRLDHRRKWVQRPVEPRRRHAPGRDRRPTRLPPCHRRRWPPSRSPGCRWGR
jgi:hypothetical protein